MPHGAGIGLVVAGHRMVVPAIAWPGTPAPTVPRLLLRPGPRILVETTMSPGQSRADVADSVSLNPGRIAKKPAWTDPIRHRARIGRKVETSMAYVLPDQPRVFLPGARHTPGSGMNLHPTPIQSVSAKSRVRSQATRSGGDMGRPRRRIEDEYPPADFP